jgi:hypothetical protein
MIPFPSATGVPEKRRPVVTVAGVAWPAYVPCEYAMLRHT